MNEEEVAKLKRQRVLLAACSQIYLHVWAGEPRLWQISELDHFPEIHKYSPASLEVYRTPEDKRHREPSKAVIVEAN